MRFMAGLVAVLLLVNSCDTLEQSERILMDLLKESTHGHSCTPDRQL